MKAGDAASGPRREAEHSKAREAFSSKCLEHETECRFDENTRHMDVKKEKQPGMGLQDP